MTIGDEVEVFLKTVVADRVFSVESWTMVQDGNATTVTFFTPEGKAVAVFNEAGLKNFIENLQVCHEDLTASR